LGEPLFAVGEGSIKTTDEAGGMKSVGLSGGDPLAGGGIEVAQ